MAKKLLRTTLARAVRRNLGTLRALVLHENAAMLRLAHKVGFEPHKSSGLTVELELDLSHVRDTVMAAAYAVAPIDAIEAAIR